MPFKIEQEFDVQAPVERVWEYLIAPARVVVCIPGAELLESRDDGTYLGAIKVKVGPMTMSYKGQIKFAELDAEAHQVRMIGEGREASGAGSAKVTMSSRVTPLDGGGAHVVVQADMDLVGKIVQFGRGMIEEISRQLFRQFSTCVKQHLEVPDEPRPTAAESIGPAAPQVEPQAEPQAPRPQPHESRTRDEAPAENTQAVSALPLMLRAFRAMIARFFMRLFGKQAG